MGNKAMSWLEWVKGTLAMEGKVEIHLKNASPYMIEWTQSDILSEDLADFKKTIAPIARDEISESELDFLKDHPEFAETELFLRACAPLLTNKDETIDWNAAREKIGETIISFYFADIASFGPKAIEPLLNDLYLFATLKKKGENDILGFVLCAITPSLPFGDIKIINLVVKHEEKSKGLEKVLLSLILKLIPQAKRLVFFVRPTNQAALELYFSLGFKKDEHPFQDPNHKIDLQRIVPLEYLAEDSILLQSAGLDLSTLRSSDSY